MRVCGLYQRSIRHGDIYKNLKCKSETEGKAMAPKELEPIKIKLMSGGESLEFFEGILGILLEPNDSGKKVCEDDANRLVRSISNGFEINFDLLDVKKNILRTLRFGTNNWRKLHGLPMIRKYLRNK